MPPQGLFLVLSRYIGPSDRVELTVLHARIIKHRTPASCPMIVHPLSDLDVWACRVAIATMIKCMYCT